MWIYPCKAQNTGATSGTRRTMPRRASRRRRDSRDSRERAPPRRRDEGRRLGEHRLTPFGGICREATLSFCKPHLGNVSPPPPKKKGGKTNIETHKRTQARYLRNLRAQGLWVILVDVLCGSLKLITLSARSAPSLGHSQLCTVGL